MHEMIDSFPQAPLPTQVEDVEMTNQIIQDEGKTIAWNLLPTHKSERTVPWQRKKVKKMHTAIKQDAIKKPAQAATKREGREEVGNETTQQGDNHCG